MSNTQYGKTLNLRMDESDRQALYFAVMQAIMTVSANRVGGPPGGTTLTAKDRHLLAKLRSLLERLGNVQ